METRFFGLLGSLQDSHVGVSNFVTCYGLRGLTFVLNLSFKQRLDQTGLGFSSFVSMQVCFSYLKEEESFFLIY